MSDPNHLSEIDTASDDEAQDEDVSDVQAVAVNYEQSEEVQNMLSCAPFALPLPVELLKENRVGVSRIPKGHLLNHYIGDLDVRVSQNAPKSRPTGLDAYRKMAGTNKAASEWSRDEAPLISTPLESTNRGRNPNSRFYIRGVLHSEPIRLYLGAMATFLIVWLVPTAVASALLLILSSEMPDQFSWVSPLFLCLPAALFLVGLIYLIFGITASCCICNQKLFIYRARAKNAQAHRFPGLGYVLPLCMHLMVFRWFRCTHCGTPIRLKK